MYLIHISLQPCDQKLLRRSQNRLKYCAQHTTSDEQIIAYHWLLLDIDPQRPADTASSEAELQLSADLLIRVEQEVLNPLGIKTTKGLSGNGVHGLIKIESQLAVEKTQSLVKEILETLADRFNTDQVKVDTSVFNPSRITKVMGTMAVKGDNTQQAPHRRALWLAELADSPACPVDIQQLHQSLCPQPRRANQYLSRQW